MRRILSDQPLRPSELVAIRKLRRHIAKSVRSDFQFKVRFVHLASGAVVARIVDIGVTDDPPAVGALPEQPQNPYCSDYDWAAGVVFDDEVIEKHKNCGPECPVKRAALPEPSPVQPTVTTRLAGDGAAICRQCNKTFWQADGEECLCHRCWAAGLTLGGITPPWPAPKQERPESIEQWEWELGKTDPEQKICGYCGAPYYPGNAVYCAPCVPANTTWPGGAA